MNQHSSGRKQQTSQKPKAQNTNIRLHPRNLHIHGYDMEQLVRSYPLLSGYITTTPANRPSIDFSHPKAVKALNAALLAHHYQIKAWDIPQGYLCPPIPGRVDYLHHLADLLAQSNGGEIPEGDKVRGLDIGTGANCIYPLLGYACYGWHFAGSEIDTQALQSASKNIENNKLQQVIEIRKQANAKAIFDGIININETFAFSLCNPPFHQSAQQAAQGSARKQKNLGHKAHAPLNFGGQHQELWCPGGELAFIRKMIKQSQPLANRILWFTSLVSKQENLRPIKVALKAAGAQQIQTIKMGQGQKISRFIAWSYFTPEQQTNWWSQG